jgi:hypothetical protein
MQTKHEIPIPENHTEKVQILDGKVVVTFEPIIDLSRIKTGSKVFIKYTNQHYRGIEAIDVSQSVDVVFFNTQHRISDEPNFSTCGDPDRTYCTFFQNGKFVLFSAKNINYITGVVRY